MAGPVTAEQRKQLDIVLAAGRQLLALISDFLDISKIEAGAITSGPRRCTCPTISATSSPLRRPRARARAIDLDVRTDDCEIVVAADVKRVRQVLGNLVSNALKFTDAGRVCVRFETRQNTALVSVEDSRHRHPGPAPCRLCSSRSRASRSRATRAREGTGLGLAIARRLTRPWAGRSWR